MSIQSNYSLLPNPFQFLNTSPSKISEQMKDVKISLTGFQYLLNNVSQNAKSLEEKMIEFTKYLSLCQTKTENWHHCWIAIPKKEKDSELDVRNEKNEQLFWWFNLVLTEAAYDSNTLAEHEELSLSQQISQKEEKETDRSYYFIKVFMFSEESKSSKEEKEDSPILVLRASKNGKSGELIHMQAVPGQLTGNQMKTFLSRPLCDFLNVEYIFLNDSSKIPVKVCLRGGNGKRDLNLRSCYPIVDLLGKTWYSKEEGYYPLTCYNIEVYNKKSLVSISQDAHLYFAAVKKVRQTSLLYLHDSILKDSSELQTELTRLSEKYLKASPAQLENKTIHDLASCLFTTLKNDNSKPIGTDVFKFYANFLTPSLKEKESKEARYYQVALDVIKKTQFWVKTKAEQPKSVFQSSSSFDEILNHFAPKANCLEEVLEVMRETSEKSSKKAKK